MDRYRMNRVAVAIAFVFFAWPIFYAAQAVAEEAPRMSKEVLLALLDNPEVNIIDVRRGKDWKGSNMKIQGAVRENNKNIAWADKYQEDKILVLYCA